MKVAITGHTAGIGKELYNYFSRKNAEVIGMSRSNGYDLETSVDSIIENAKDCDIFIDNAYRDEKQLELLNGLYKHVHRIVVCGSVSRFYPELILTDYVHDKQVLADRCRILSLAPDGVANILHLDLSFIELTDVNLNDPLTFTSDNFIKYNEIVSAIDFWLHNPKIRQMEFVWKLTPIVYNQLKRANPDHTELDKLYREVLDL
jgi:hypothetical protein